MACIIEAVIDAIMENERLNNTPGVSGVDYLGFYIYPMFVGLFSIIGVITSAISTKLFTNKVLKELI